MIKVVFTGRVGEVDSEDGGQALITQVDPSSGFTVQAEGADVGDENNGFFVRLQSWSEITGRRRKPKHAFMDAIRGRRVRVTVEVIEDETPHD